MSITGPCVLTLRSLPIAGRLHGWDSHSLRRSVYWNLLVTKYRNAAWKAIESRRGICLHIRDQKLYNRPIQSRIATNVLFETEGHLGLGHIGPVQRHRQRKDILGTTKRRVSKMHIDPPLLFVARSKTFSCYFCRTTHFSLAHCQYCTKEVDCCLINYESTRYKMPQKLGF